MDRINVGPFFWLPSPFTTTTAAIYRNPRASTEKDQAEVGLKKLLVQLLRVSGRGCLSRARAHRQKLGGSLGLGWFEAAEVVASRFAQSCFSSVLTQLDTYAHSELNDICHARLLTQQLIFPSLVQQTCVQHCVRAEIVIVKDADPNTRVHWVCVGNRNDDFSAGPDSNYP